jgi:GNAT superfamily N-acetyltransferase
MQAIALTGFRKIGKPNDVNASTASPLGDGTGSVPGLATGNCVQVRDEPLAYIRQATRHDTGKVAEVLLEAAQRLEQGNMSMWRGDELRPSRIATDVGAGLFFIAECDGEATGVMKFQLEDGQFWPDVPQGESVYVHWLAVRRHFAGGGVSLALLNWAVERVRSHRRDYLRLDCEASRPKLRAVYENFGFVHHSDRQVGPYVVARYEYKVGRLLADQSP